ncbi:MAG: hypothetical protein WCF70_11165 [Dehalococcoidales bacterium]|jgi:hypothetical protein
MKILIFTEGTILMHQSAAGLTRDEIIKQVQNHFPGINDFTSYIPIGNSVSKLNHWAKAGAEIIYLTSRRKPAEIEAIRNVLNRHGFPQGRLLFRQGKQTYKDIAEAVLPDVLVEDDCESIGGAEQMTTTNVDAAIKRRIKSIVVREYGGIDHLPDKIESL